MNYTFTKSKGILVSFWSLNRDLGYGSYYLSSPKYPISQFSCKPISDKDHMTGGSDFVHVLPSLIDVKHLSRNQIS